MCALGFMGADCATASAPNSRDCSTGCVHLCATRCALAGGAGRSSAASAAASYAALALGEINGEIAGVDCFATCRKTCVGACHSFSGQRALWASGRRRTPTAELANKAAASRALHLPVPSAAALQPAELRSIENTMPHAGMVEFGPR